ncbi:MAG: hypothetical protein NTX29_11325 [Actinobacteria bacterium]|nr:hypothetical protein [Actinomycetota bacterium]
MEAVAAGLAALVALVASLVVESDEHAARVEAATATRPRVKPMRVELFI